MAMDYGKCAKEIYETLGGRDNLVSAAHCATRLRLVTVDNGKIDMKKLENIDGVRGVFSNNGQLQLIIGTGTVNKVYDEFLKISGMTAATKEEVKAAAAAKQPVLKRMIKALGDVFVPILPAIVASGLMMGLVEALGKAIPSFAGSDWYGILDLMANTAFTFLPVLVAVSATRVFWRKYFSWGGNRHDNDSPKPDERMVGRKRGCCGYPRMEAVRVPYSPGRVSGTCHSCGNCHLADVQNREMAA